MADPFRAKIRVIPDSRTGSPMFDASLVLADGRWFAEAIELMAAPFASQGIRVVIGVEAKGFYFAAPLAIRLGAGFVAARKPGKLPGKTLAAKARLTDEIGIVGAEARGGGSVNGLATYPKPYEFEIHAGMIQPGDRLLVVDDLLAKGGSALACCQLAERCGANVIGCVFLTELVGLGGRTLLAPRSVHCLVPFAEVRVGESPP